MPKRARITPAAVRGLTLPPAINKVFKQIFSTVVRWDALERQGYPPQFVPRMDNQEIFPGHTIQASDRSYVVAADGSLRRML